MEPVRDISYQDFPEEPGSAERLPEDRRSFIAIAWLGWIAFSGALLGALASTARFFFPNDPIESEARFKIGRPEDFSPGSVDGRWKAARGIWVVREGRELFVLSATCTHLRCTINWLPQERKFKCPCHGSGFSVEGINSEGPAPRPLERYGVALAPGGQIEVDKSRIFREEFGGWTDPDSFLVLDGPS